MIVVAGEALVDLIPTPAGDLSINPGGGPFNTARWLARLGADVAFLGSFAADPLGQRLRDELVAAGVSLDLVVASEHPTTLALTQLDPDGAAQYSFYTHATASADLHPRQVEQLLPERPEALYVGSLGLVLEPIATAVTRAVAIARQREALVMLDPNIRQVLIGDRQGYLSRLHGVLAQTDVVKLSVEDVAWLAPGEPPLAAARALLDQGPSLVILTAGAQGATVLTAGAATTIPALPVDVVDTIGAGDAFSAGFLVHWLRKGHGGRNAASGSHSPPASDGAALIDAATVAVQVGGIACAVQGATPPQDLAALLSRP